MVVKIERELDATPQNNAAMREVVARGGKYGEFGLQLFAPLLPFNEKHAIEEGIPELDVLQMHDYSFLDHLSDVCSIGLEDIDTEQIDFALVEIIE